MYYKERNKQSVIGIQGERQRWIPSRGIWNSFTEEVMFGLCLAGRWRWWLHRLEREDGLVLSRQREQHGQSPGGQKAPGQWHPGICLWAWILIGEESKCGSHGEWSGRGGYSLSWRKLFICQSVFPSPAAVWILSHPSPPPGHLPRFLSLA